MADTLPMAGKVVPITGGTAYDADMAARLWQVSTDLVGMTPATPVIPVGRVQHNGPVPVPLTS